MCQKRLERAGVAAVTPLAPDVRPTVGRSIPVVQVGRARSLRTSEVTIGAAALLSQCRLPRKHNRPANQRRKEEKVHLVTPFGKPCTKPRLLRLCVCRSRIHGPKCAEWRSVCGILPDPSEEFPPPTRRKRTGSAILACFCRILWNSACTIVHAWLRPQLMLTSPARSTRPTLETWSRW
jgi:hypothetical protein